MLIYITQTDDDKVAPFGTKSEARQSLLCIAPVFRSAQMVHLIDLPTTKHELLKLMANPEEYLKSIPIESTWRMTRRGGLTQIIY